MKFHPKFIQTPSSFHHFLTDGTSNCNGQTIARRYRYDVIDPIVDPYFNLRFGGAESSPPHLVEVIAADVRLKFKLVTNLGTFESDLSTNNGNMSLAGNHC